MKIFYCYLLFCCHLFLFTASGAEGSLDGESLIKVLASQRQRFRTGIICYKEIISEAPLSKKEAEGGCFSKDAPEKADFSTISVLEWQVRFNSEATFSEWKELLEPGTSEKELVSSSLTKMVRQAKDRRSMAVVGPSDNIDRLYYLDTVYNPMGYLKQCGKILFDGHSLSETRLTVEATSDNNHIFLRVNDNGSLSEYKINSSEMYIESAIMRSDEERINRTYEASDFVQIDDQLWIPKKHVYCIATRDKNNSIILYRKERTITKMAFNMPASEVDVTLKFEEGQRVQDSFTWKLHTIGKDGKYVKPAKDIKKDDSMLIKARSKHPAVHKTNNSLWMYAILISSISIISSLLFVKMRRSKLK